MKLFVYHTPEATPVDSLPDCAVVIDVLRATTTIATALNVGAEAVHAFSDLDKLRQESENYPADKRLRAGERGGAKVEDFDLGNSPLDCTPEVVRAKQLFLSTTNGTRALQRVENAPILITAAQINRQTAVNYILEQQPETVWLVGSGWQGGYSIEDTACAGAIALPILNRLEQSQPDIIGNDEVIAAIALYSRWENDLIGMFHQASHGKRLLALNCEDDLKYCAQTDILDILPIQSKPGVLVKH